MAETHPTDTNVELVLEQFNTMTSILIDIKNDVTAIKSKQENYEDRLRKVELHDEKHTENENDLKLILTRIETALDNRKLSDELLVKRQDKFEKDLQKFEDRLDISDSNINTVKTKWSWTLTLMSIIGAVIGFITTVTFNILHLFK